MGWASTHRALMFAFAALLGVVLFLYPPARAYYVAARNNAMLQAKVEQVNASNDVLQGEVNTLLTREGIEDEARRLGYVSEGDTAVDMSGVDDSGGATSDAGVTDATGTDMQTGAWYTPVLDALFGYDPSTQGVN